MQVRDQTITCQIHTSGCSDTYAAAALNLISVIVTHKMKSKIASILLIVEYKPKSANFPSLTSVERFIRLFQTYHGS